MDSTEYDAIVIGTGQGGAPLASALATAGLWTAILERSTVGGSCINVGCTDGVFAHPTLAESLNNLFGNFQD